MTSTGLMAALVNGATLALLLALTVVAGGATPDAGALLDTGLRAIGNGRFDEAAASLESAAGTYRKLGDAAGEVQATIGLATAYQALGHHRRATATLEEALARNETRGTPRELALLKSRLGAVLAMTQETERAGTLLREALESARALQDAHIVAATLNDLGNLLGIQQDNPGALAAYMESASLATSADNHTLAAQAQCNAAATAARAENARQAMELNRDAIQAISRLETSYNKGFLLLNAGRTDQQLASQVPDEAQKLLLRAHQSLSQALELAHQIDSRSLETYALGYMAQLYESDGQVEAALSLARRAAFAAQQAQMPEALYRWEWQVGRLLRRGDATEPATAAYRRAVRTLQEIRHDVSLGYGNAATRRSFRESEGPLFLELADLLLEQSSSTADSAAEQSLLLEARDVVEQLKNVELAEYFCDDCADIRRSRARPIEAIAPGTAVIYLIPLETRTEILVGLASGLKRFTADVPSAALSAEVRQFRRNLETRTTYRYLEQAQQLYNWLIRPIRGLLATHGIDTLVFVPDGPLRTIPMASLHDGERFLIQDLAVAVAPGLSLVDPQPLQRRNVRLLLNGISKPVQGFEPLDFVPAELQTIAPSYPSETLMDERFTLEKVSRKLTGEQFSIVHIASHGQFHRDVRKTFVLTYDAKLTLNDLESLIRPSQYRGRPVDLLVLSACQTAAGDDRAALGLGGIAVKAGARSALATLWFVNDQSTSELVSEIYRQLVQSPGVTKAGALRAAQVKLLGDRRYRHPCYWSPYLLIGNWL